MNKLSHKTGRPINRKEVLGGLQPTPEDVRDFSMGGLFGKLELPPNIDFMVGKQLKIKDQEEDGLEDGCTGYSLTSVSEKQEGVLLDPGFTFAMIKMLQGNLEWGGDLRSGAKVAQKIGFIEVGQNPKDFGGKPRNFIANWKNWDLDLLKPLALAHKKETYVKVEAGGYDTFDSIRAALWNKKDENQTVYTGSVWRPGWLWAKDGLIPNQRIDGGVGHAFEAVGQVMFKNEPRLQIPNTYGDDVGKDGYHFFSRETVNREFTFSAFQFIDMPRIEVEKELEKKGLLFTTLEEKKINAKLSFWDWVKDLLLKYELEQKLCS